MEPMKITLTRGLFARHTYRGGEQQTIIMHRAILNAPPGVPVDHANGNGLDNRKANLRTCSSSQNSQNRRRVSGAVRLKGVTVHKATREEVVRLPLGTSMSRLYEFLADWYRRARAWVRLRGERT